MTEHAGTWNEHGTDLVLDDGTRITLFSEHVRGEPRFYWAEVLTPADADSARWRRVPDAAGENKRTVMRRMERYADTLHAEATT